MAFGDPFDAAGADMPPQQAGGVSPDFWRNLAMFGSQMSVAANARTPQGFLAYGNGFAGPFGAGIQGGMQNSMDVAKLRSNLGLQNAQTQGVSADTLLKQFQIPFMQQKMRMLSDPRVMDSLFGDLGVAPGAAPGPQSSAAPTEGSGPQIAGSPYARGIATMESNGKPDAQNPNWSVANGGPLGPHQFTADTWNAFRQENPQYFANMTPEQAMAARTDPNLSATATDWLAQKNAGVLQQAGIPATPQNLGIAHALGGAGAAGVLKFPDETPLSQALQVTQPNAAQQILTQNPQYAKMTVGDLKRKYSGLSAPGDGRVQYAQAGNVATDASTAPAPQQGAQPAQAGNIAPGSNAPAPQQRVQVAQAGNGPIPLPGAGPAPQPTNPGATQQQQPASAPVAGHMSPGYITPQEAFQRADAYQRKAVALQAIGLDATPATQRAQQWQDYGQKQLLQQTANQTIRGPGSASINPASGKIIQSPLEYEITGPDMRTYRITQNAVETGEPYTRPQGVPSWAPPGTLSIALAKPSPGETEAAKEASMDAFGEKARSQYASAAGTMRSMEDLDQQMDRLNAGGPSWYNTGAGADFKLSLGKAINAISRSSGAPDIFDPDKLASGEDILKQSKLAGMQTLQAFFGGSREAASIVQSTQAAVPNLENTPFGGKLVLNGIKEAARWQMDQHAFMTNWYYSHAGNMVGADVAFTQQYAPQKYTRRAISQVRPVEIPGNDPKELNRFLPGTRFTVKGDETHSVREVPGQADVQLQMPDQHPSLAAPVQ